MTERILDAADIDRLGQAIVSLTKEIWILRDRQRVLEQLLVEHNVLAPDAVATYVPDQALSDELQSERQALISSVLTVLSESHSGS